MMKKNIAILLTISLLACSFGLMGCAVQKETNDEASNVSVTNIDVSESKETVDKASESDENSRETSLNSKESTAVSSTVEESGKDTASSVAESAEPSQSTPPETRQPSDISVPEASHSSQETPKGTLTASPQVKEKYGKFVYYDSIESSINFQYPSITQEQFDQIVALRIGNSARSMPYQEGVITGTIDPSAPRLTLEKVKEIIADAKGRELESDKVVLKKNHKGILDYPDCYGGYIYSEINKIQPPDYIPFFDPPGIHYYLSENAEGVHLEEISIYSQGATLKINHIIRKDDGEYDVEERLYTSE